MFRASSTSRAAGRWFDQCSRSLPGYLRRQRGDSGGTESLTDRSSTRTPARCPSGSGSRCFSSDPCMRNISDDGSDVRDATHKEPDLTFAVDERHDRSSTERFLLGCAFVTEKTLPSCLRREDGPATEHFGLDPDGVAKFGLKLPGL